MPFASRVVAIAVLVASLALGGCVRRSDPYGQVPRVDSRRLRNLHHLASREMACPAAALSARAISERVWQVAGCGQVREFAIVARGGRGARWRAVVPIAQRAAAEMACPESALTLAAPHATERAVVGCGRSARYAMVCNEVDCAWVMSAHAGAWSEPQPAAPIPAPMVVVVQPGAPSAAPVAPEVNQALRDAIDQQAQAVRACGASDAITVVARWSADGRVEVVLAPPHGGSALEACVRQAIGGLQVTSGMAGEIVHVVP